jgi:transposase
MGSRHPNHRLAKIHRSYSVEEMAYLFSVHKNTVRNWIEQGLEPIDGQRPTVVRGEEKVRCS